MWHVIHQLHQQPRFVDNGSTVTPGKNSREESSNFNVLLFRKQVRNADRIVRYERWLIVLRHLVVEKFFYGNTGVYQL